MPDAEPTPACVVKITKELRDAAATLANSVLRVDYNEIQRTEVLGVVTCFETAAEAGKAAAQLTALKTAVVETGEPGVSVQEENEPTVVFALLELFLPPLFALTTDKIRATKLDSFQMPASHFTLAELFLAAYDHPTVVFHRFHSPPDYCDTGWYAEIQSAVLLAHEMMIGFLRALVKLKPTGPSHRTVITADFTIKVDGVEPKLGSAQRRCVLALACLRHQESFTVVEFAKFYSGKVGVKVEVGKKDFNNAIKVTKDVLPYFKHDARSGNRIVSGIVWRVFPTDDQLEQHLRLLRPVRE